MSPKIKIVGTTLVAALLFAVVYGAIENALIAARLADLPRLTTDFSPAYLQRRIRSLAAAPQTTVVFGDSVLWGYRIQPQQNAIALLRARGLRLENLAFKGSSPPNYFALLSTMHAYGVKPAALLVEVNDKVFNPEDDAYHKLNASVAALARPSLAAADLTNLALPPAPAGPAAVFDGALKSVWLTYAMRADIRETLFGDADAPPPKPTPDLYEGTYDLTPLDEKNLGMLYLDKTVDLARSMGVPVIAFLTPTNHALLHDYIDSPEYGANIRFIGRELTRRGAHVIDLDRAFPTSDFLDNSHLTPAGQQRLAGILAGTLTASLGRDGGRTGS
jgi:hypothetical protein